MRQLVKYAALAAGFVVMTSPAFAAAERLGVFGDWTAFKATSDGAVVCYALGKPKSTLPKNVKRDPISFMISNFPAASVKGEPSIVPGYPYKDGSKATAEIGGENFSFTTVNVGTNGGAWIPDPADERKLVTAMRSGANMVVKGTSRRGTLTTDTYSLSGISAALDKINEACP